MDSTYHPQPEDVMRAAVAITRQHSIPAVVEPVYEAQHDQPKRVQAVLPVYRSVALAMPSADFDSFSSELTAVVDPKARNAVSAPLMQVAAPTKRIVIAIERPLGRTHMRVTASPATVLGDMVAFFSTNNIQASPRTPSPAVVVEGQGCFAHLVGKVCDGDSVVYEAEFLLFPAASSSNSTVLDVQLVDGSCKSFMTMFNSLQAAFHVDAPKFTLPTLSMCLPVLPSCTGNQPAPFTAEDGADIPQLVHIAQSEQLDTQEYGLECLAAVAVNPSCRDELINLHVVQTAVQVLSNHTTDLAVVAAATLVAELCHVQAARAIFMAAAATTSVACLFQWLNKPHTEETIAQGQQCLRALRVLCSDAALRTKLLQSGAAAECQRVLRVFEDPILRDHAAAVLQL